MDSVEAYKKRISSLETRLKNSDNPMEQRQLRSMLGSLYKELAEAKHNKNR